MKSLFSCSTGPMALQRLGACPNLQLRKVEGLCLWPRRLTHTESLSPPHEMGSPILPWSLARRKPSLLCLHASGPHATMGGYVYGSIWSQSFITASMVRVGAQVGTGSSLHETITLGECPVDSSVHGHRSHTHTGLSQVPALLLHARNCASGHLIPPECARCPAWAA